METTTQIFLAGLAGASVLVGAHYIKIGAAGAGIHGEDRVTAQESSAEIHHAARSSQEEASGETLEDSHRKVGYLTPEDSTPEHTLGNRQSPINILTSRAKEGQHETELHYRASEEHIRNLGHTIEVDWDAGSSIEFDGKNYELKQFHFHTPSEHLLDGVTYPMEIHLVHVGVDDPEHMLVVGALFKEGEGNPIIDRVLPYVPKKPGGVIDAHEKLDVSALFGKDDGYYFYSGSLTTPPYSEIVNWLVLDQVFQASPEQIEEIARVEGYNARHIQAPHARMVDHCRFSRIDGKRGEARHAVASPGRQPSEPTAQVAGL